ncbi:hypothetical protein TRFO_33123 [Tritrichomonas foetus]|uniref:Uncharacterized protein n=1 Tax=Tritrichomonas foetus TaxID=1144522 RepID=A0A1J4JMB6_9EUKA|nr:hypothetical protein TRFO_33123 [Tritrichomonas foetus]|eukprot:OHT00247.1 hypothetical protein TRFO_33123 [Tritrichomonas foetus]
MNTSNWSVSDVANYLEKLGLSQYANTFVSNDIDGRVLPYLDDSYLKEMGITSIGHRILLKRFISQIRNEEETFPKMQVFDDSIHPLDQSLHYQLFVAPLDEEQLNKNEEKTASAEPQENDEKLECEICHQKIPFLFFEKHCNTCRTVFDQCKREYERRNMNFTDQQIIDLINGKVPENHIQLEKCEFCGRKYSKSSFSKHTESCKKRHEEIQKKNGEKLVAKNKSNRFMEEHEQLIQRIKAQRKEFKGTPDNFPKIEIKGTEAI